MTIVIGSAFRLFLSVSERRFICEGTIFSTRKVGDDPQSEGGVKRFLGGVHEETRNVRGSASGRGCRVVPWSRRPAVPQSRSPRKRVGR